MDLLSIIGSVWRHKLVALPVILLTIAGVFYVVAVKAPVYEASGSILLLSPPAPPTPQQIAKNPRLGRVNTQNPYADLGITVAADALLNVLTAPAAQQTLLKEGADPRYQVILSSAFGAPPIIQITGIGTSAAQAIQSARLVAGLAAVDLNQMQKKQNVNNRYMIRTAELVQPKQAQQSASGKLRTLIAVLALGAILLFLVVSLTEVLQKRQSARSVDTDGLAPNPRDGPRAPRYMRATREDEFTDDAGRSAAAHERLGYGAQPSGRSRRTLGSRDA